MLVVIVSACCGSSGGDGSVDEARGSTTTEPATATTDSVATSAASALPPIDVVHVASKQTAGLRTYLTSGRPALLWFWAPHCQFCIAEAPEMRAFAEKYAGRIDVLGVGAQDSLSQAEDFVEKTSTEMLDMVWDKSGDSWITFNVTNQPTVVVLSPSGEVKLRKFRQFNEQEIVAAAGL